MSGVPTTISTRRMIYKNGGLRFKIMFNLRFNLQILDLWEGLLELNICCTETEISYRDVVKTRSQTLREKRREFGGTRVWASLCSLALMRGHTELTLSPATKMHQRVCNISSLGKPMGSSVPEVFNGSGYIGTICPPWTQIQIPRRKTGLRH